MTGAAGEGGSLGSRGADLGLIVGVSVTPSGGPGPGQVFGQHSPGRETEILKNWKPDIILGIAARQDFRISPLHLLPGYLAG